MSNEPSDLLKHCKDASTFLSKLAEKADAGEELSAQDLLRQLASVVQQLCQASEEISQQAERLAFARSDLLAQSEHYRDFFELAPDGFCVTTVSGVILEANAATVRMLHVEPKDLIGQPLNSFVAKELRPRLTSVIASFVSGKKRQIASLEMALKPRKGKPFIALITASAGRDESGVNVKELRWVIHDVSAHKQLEHERQLLLERLVNAQEEERARIARDLHDKMAQHITALIIGLEALNQEGKKGTDCLADVANLQAISQAMAGEVHQIALELRPPALDELGLLKALSYYAQEWSKRSGVDISVHISGSECSKHQLSQEVSTAAYRIVQESLTNVVKHAHASHVSLVVESGEDHLTAIVEDNGVGFDASRLEKSGRAVRSCLGLIGMRERATLVGGSIRIESTKGSGTTVILRIPVNNETPGGV